MIDVNASMQRDALLQYLAMYEVSQGMTKIIDPEKVFDKFVQFKWMLIRKEATLEWLCDSIIKKYGTPPDPVQSRPDLSGIIMLPTNVVNNLMDKSNKKPSGNVAIDTLPSLPEVDLAMINDIRSMLDGIKEAYNLPDLPIHASMPPKVKRAVKKPHAKKPSVNT